MDLTDLDRLVTRLRHLRKKDPRFSGLKVLACSRLVLKLEYGVDPSEDAVIELAKQAKKSCLRDREFLSEDIESEQECDENNFKGRDGRVIRKSEPMSG